MQDKIHRLKGENGVIATPSHIGPCCFMYIGIQWTGLTPSCSVMGLALGWGGGVGLSLE